MQLLRQPGMPLPSWLPEALVYIALVVAALARMQASLPRRAAIKEQAAVLAALQSVAEQFGPPADPTFLAALAEYEAKAERLRTRMTGRGRPNAWTKFGLPSSALVCATGVVALCCIFRGSPSSHKNAGAQALCQAILELARELAGSAALAPSQRPVGWSRHLHRARDGFGSVQALVARGMVDAMIELAQLRAAAELDQEGHRIR